MCLILFIMFLGNQDFFGPLSNHWDSNKIFHIIPVPSLCYTSLRWKKELLGFIRYLGSWRDGSVSLVPVTQAWGSALEFPSTHTNNNSNNNNINNHWQAPIILDLGMQRQRDPKGLLASQSSSICRLQEILFQRVRRRETADAWRWPLDFHVHMNKHNRHTHIYCATYTCTKTHIGKSLN